MHKLSIDFSLNCMQCSVSVASPCSYNLFYLVDTVYKQGEYAPGYYVSGTQSCM